MNIQYDSNGKPRPQLLRVLPEKGEYTTALLSTTSSFPNDSRKEESRFDNGDAIVDGLPPLLDRDQRDLQCAGQFLVSISLESMLEEILFGQRKVKTRWREEKECSAKRPHRMCQCFFSCKSNQVRSMPSKSAMERYFTAPGARILRLGGGTGIKKECR